jgi:hypothetical protein
MLNTPEMAAYEPSPIKLIIMQKKNKDVYELIAELHRPRRPRLTDFKIDGDHIHPHIIESNDAAYQ